MENAFFYTFSTIAQTLGGALALLGAFVLYRLQGLSAEIDHSAAIVRTHSTSASTRQAMTAALIARKYAEIAALAKSPDETATVPEFGADLARLEELLTVARRVRRTFVLITILSGCVLIGSVAILAFTPELALCLDSWFYLLGGLTAFSLVIGSYVWFLVDQVS